MLNKPAKQLREIRYDVILKRRSELAEWEQVEGNTLPTRVIAILDTQNKNTL